jgi:glycerol uptake facilitator protein
LATEAQQLLNGWQSKTHLANALGWGLALLMAAQLGYRVSAHLNPAVSLVAFTFGQLSFCHFLLYSLVQTAGAYLGALLTYALYFGWFSSKI